MSEYLFLYRGGSRPESPAEGEQVMQKWISWMQDLETKGHLKDRGQPLEGEGKVVRGKQRSITDGPVSRVEGHRRRLHTDRGEGSGRRRRSSPADARSSTATASSKCDPS